MSAMANFIREVKNAPRGKRTAIMHYQALVNAEGLEGSDLKALCQDAGICETYATEIRKMIALKKIMKESGTTLFRKEG